MRGPDQASWRQAKRDFRQFVVPSSEPKDKSKIKEGKPAYCVRGTYGCNITYFTGTHSSGTADLKAVQLLLNANVSKGVFQASGDAHDYYLATVLDQPEYM